MAYFRRNISEGTFNPGTRCYGRPDPMKGIIFLKTTFLVLAAFSAESGWESAVLTRLSSCPELDFLRRKSFLHLQFNRSADRAQTQGIFFIQATEATRTHPPGFENWPYKKGSSNFFSWDTVKYRLSFSLACGFTICLSWHRTGSCGKRWFCPPIPRFLPLPGVSTTGCVSLQPEEPVKTLNKHEEPRSDRRFLIPGGAAELQPFLTLWQCQSLRRHSWHCQNVRMENESWSSHYYNISNNHNYYSENNCIDVLVNLARVERR